MTAARSSDPSQQTPALPPRDCWLIHRYGSGAPLGVNDLESPLGKTILQATFDYIGANGAEPWPALRKVLLTQSESVRRAILAIDPDKEPGADPKDSATEQRGWTHTALLTASFAALEMVVHGLVVAGGLTILGGKPKGGKSWLVLQMAQAVAAGVRVLGLETRQGAVLYLCLEDGERRLQERLWKQGAPDDLPIHYYFELRPLNTLEGKADLEELIAQHHPVLVIIDTIAAAKTGKLDENEAGGMADLYNWLRRLGQREQAGILVVAHHKKGAGGDVGDDMRGSSAVPGAADINLGLYKTDSGSVLKSEGRDIGEEELRLKFDVLARYSWQLVGDARKLAKTEAEQAVLDVLAKIEPADTAALARAMSKARQTVAATVKRMVSDGLVTETTEKRGNATVLIYRTTAAAQGGE